MHKIGEINFPPICWRILINWYSKCSGNVYVDDIIEKLKDSKLGSSIGDLYLGCTMYADDLILVLVSVFMLQKMILSAKKEAEYIDMKCNASKSMAILTGK